MMDKDDGQMWEVYIDTHKEPRQPCCQSENPRLTEHDTDQHSDRKKLKPEYTYNHNEINDLSEEEIVFSVAKVDSDNAGSVFNAKDDLSGEVEAKPKRSFREISLTVRSIVGCNKGKSQHLQQEIIVSPSLYEGGEHQHDSSDDKTKRKTFLMRPVDEVKSKVSTVYGLEFSSGTDAFDESSMADISTKYCLSLLRCQFYGQTGPHDRLDKGSSERFHLGSGLRLMDEFLRHQDPLNGNIAEDSLFIELLRKIALSRRKENESKDDCFKRFEKDGTRFLQIYQDRAGHRKHRDWDGHSQPMKKHKKYWGSRQQLMSGKVIADWVDRKNGPLDPVFGVLLNPSAGRVGKGDSTLLHHFLFDEDGKYAYHSAVHDAFGYLKDIHGAGPGYNYLNQCLLKSTNALSGQVYGIKFWNEVLDHFPSKPCCMDLLSNVLFSQKNVIGWY